MLIEPIHDDAGICINLRSELLEMFDKGHWQADAELICKIDKMSGKEWAQFCFDKMLKHWPKASLATPMYPIEGGRMAYAEFRDHMWDANHYYGALRIELCNFCIEYLEKQDAKTSNIKPDDSGSPAVN